MISSNLSMACWTKMASLRFRVLRILQSAPYLHYIMIWKCYITVLYSIIFTLQRNLISIFPPLCLTLNYAAQLTFDPGGFNQFFHGHWFQNHIKSNIFQETGGAWPHLMAKNQHKFPLNLFTNDRFPLPQYF